MYQYLRFHHANSRGNEHTGFHAIFAEKKFVFNRHYRTPPKIWYYISASHKF